MADIDRQKGWTLLEKKVANASSEIDFNLLPLGFAAYKVLIDRYVPSADGDLWLRTSSDGGSTFDATNDYDYSNAGTVSTSIVAGANQNQVLLNGTNIEATQNALSGEVEIWSAYSSSIITKSLYRVIFGTSSDEIRMTHGNGKHNTAQVDNAIRLLPSTGNMASGNFYLFGLQF